MTGSPRSEVPILPDRESRTASQDYFCLTCGKVHGPKCPNAGKCIYCLERPATIHFGDMLSFTHGGSKNCCALCAAEKQLAHAQAQAALVPEREAEVARLRSELGL